MAEYVKQPKAFPSPSIFSILYYNSFNSLLLALEEVKGQLGSPDQKNLREALTALEWTSPTGPIKLDANRQAIVDNFLIEVVQGADGKLTTKQISQTSGVAQGTKTYDRFEGCPK